MSVDSCSRIDRGSLSGVIRIAALADIHMRKTSKGLHKLVFDQAAEAADVLLLCGDLTDNGLAEEARIVAKDLRDAAKKTTVLAVFGNHDFQSGQEVEIAKVLADSGIVVLDGTGCELRGVGFTGVKGFGGGFGPQALQPWGEESIKGFVHEAVNEAVKLESGLAKLRLARIVTLLHYSPVRDTVMGESPEIFPFLGSSRLEEPVNRYRVDLVFHGHSHAGQAEGRTSADIPVYNVSMPVLKRTFPHRPPFRLIELPLEEDSHT
jgi:Icc-related predicted phosphoesterase